jgi:hypothetical protein
VNAARTAKKLALHLNTKEGVTDAIECSAKQEAHSDWSSARS